MTTRTVPTEPTPEMIKAGMNYAVPMQADQIRRIWKAMINAAPKEDVGFVDPTKKREG